MPQKIYPILLIILLNGLLFSLTIEKDGVNLEIPDVDARYLGSTYTVVLYSNTDRVGEVVDRFNALSMYCGGDISPVLIVCGDDSDLIAKKITEAYSSAFNVMTVKNALPQSIPDGYLISLIDESGRTLYWSEGAVPQTIEELFVSANLPFPKAKPASKGANLPLYRFRKDAGFVDTGDMLKRGPLVIYIISPNDKNLIDDVKRMQFLSEDITGRANVLVLIDSDDTAVLKKLSDAVKIDIQVALINGRAKESFVMNDPLPVLIGVNGEGRVASRYVYTQPPNLSDIGIILGETGTISSTIPVSVVSDKAVIESVKSRWIPKAVFTPDGGGILFNAILDDGKSDNIWQVNLKDSRRKRITESESDDLCPVISGGDIYFFSTRSEGEEIWMKSDKEGFVQITDRKGFNEYPSTDSASGNIVFHSNYGGNFDVWICDSYGKNLRELSPHPSVDIQPSFAGDGSGRVVFVSERGGESDIWIVGRDGRGLYQVTNDSAVELFPSFSTDGTRIVYSSNIDGSYDIWLMTTDGLKRMKLTSGSGDEIAPSFSSDGTKIVYTEVEEGGSFAIRVMEVEEKLEVGGSEEK
jgi:Tol biopolymer transport system component